GGHIEFSRLDVNCSWLRDGCRCQRNLEQRLQRRRIRLCATNRVLEDQRIIRRDLLNVVEGSPTALKNQRAAASLEHMEVRALLLRRRACSDDQVLSRR